MTWSGIVYGMALGLVMAGLATLLAKRRRLKLGLAGLALMLLTAVVRLVSAGSGERLSSTTTGGGTSRLLTRVVDEADLAVAGAYLLRLTGWLHDPEASLVPSALRAAYRDMGAVEGDAPSPVLPTYLGMQSPERADVLVVDGVEKPRGAVIFLHGFGGSFALPCWQLALAAREAGLATFCPSTGWRGDWWSHRGARTLEKTIGLAHQRGFNLLYLAGLSNGAAGAARLGPKMRGSFRGVILISGAVRDPVSLGVPVLVLQGRHDQMSGAGLARAYADRTGGRYVDLDGGHFAFLLRRPQAHLALVEWLKAH